MKQFEIIPAIDLMNGACVRLSKGEFSTSKIYNTDPALMAQTFAAAGFNRLHVVDLDGARSGSIKNMASLQQIRVAVESSIDFGGGVKSLADMKNVASAGANFITLGSVAAEQPALVKEAISIFGPEKFFIGADVFDEHIKIQGWLKDSGKMLMDFLQEMTDLGINYFFCTDISKDGMMQGPAIDLYAKILDRFPALQLIASGGVSSLQDIEKLKTAGCSGAIVGKAIYENLIPLPELLQSSKY